MDSMIESTYAPHIRLEIPLTKPITVTLYVVTCVTACTFFSSDIFFSYIPHNMYIKSKCV